MYDARLRAVREAMKQQGVDMHMLTTDDPNFSGSIAPDKHWRTMEWLTGFSCSFGYMLITADRVTFWTDFRYITQAKNQVRLSDVEIFDVTALPSDYYLDWIGETLAAMPGKELTFAADGRTFTNARAESIRDAFGRVTGKTVIWRNQDLTGILWMDRPEPDSPALFDLDLSCAGMSRTEKLAELRERLSEAGCSAYLSVTMDTVAWLTNLRSRGEYTPMFPAYVLVDGNRAGLYCRQDKLEPGVKEALFADGFSTFETEEIGSAIGSLSAGTVLFHDRINDDLAQSIPAGLQVIKGRDPVSQMKAIKNPAEAECFRKANLADGVVLVRIIKRLKEEVSSAGFHELDFTPMFNELRKEQEGFLCNGGPTMLAAYMANAASPHYFPGPGRNCEVKPEGVLLFDTGANYDGATTDISRTIYLGPCEYEEELTRDYTISLKSLIALARQKFRKGTDGAYLDSVARCVLWNEGLNYSYGTGHGIGACLNCHEGPQILAESTYRKEWAASNVPIVPGMVVSNEPGVYKVGKYGIRVENDQLVVEAFQNEFGEFYQFETLSYCPFEPKLIDPALLSDEELAWLNDYHAKTCELLSPRLTEEEAAWLKEQTAVIRKKADI